LQLWRLLREHIQQWLAIWPHSCASGSNAGVVVQRMAVTACAASVVCRPLSSQHVDLSRKCVTVVHTTAAQTATFMEILLLHVLLEGHNH
jgi:hypothetical protein